VTDQVPIQAVPNRHNEEYLRTKRERLGHTLHHQGLPLDEELIHDEHQREKEREALGAQEADPEDG
jgi:3,4-dihydroxy 2-butanone 4-phosphate synthase / GTP cyclohydrolase II